MFLKNFRNFVTKTTTKSKRLTVVEKTKQFVQDIKDQGIDYKLKVEPFSNPDNKYPTLLNSDGEYSPETLTIAAWNLNGIRAVIKKGDLQLYLNEYQPDILCLSETKIDEKRFNKLDKSWLPEGYIDFWNFCKPPHAGYSGTAILTKYAPLNVTYGLGIPEHDAEGRVVTCEFEDFHVLSVYTPNIMDGNTRLEYRIFDWDVAFMEHCQKLKDTGKLIIVTGDLNVCHEPIDIHNPRLAEGSQGYTFWERGSFAKALKTLDLVDSFRELYPETSNYTWWSNRGKGMRSRNLGRRIDYVLMEEKVITSIVEAEILNDIMGSDHCPVSVTLNTKRLKLLSQKDE